MDGGGIGRPSFDLTPLAPLSINGEGGGIRRPRSGRLMDGGGK